MLKSYTIKVPLKRFFGDVYSKEFSLPNSVGKITDVCVVCDFKATPENAAAFRAAKGGMASVSINDNELITLPVLLCNKLNNKSLTGNFVKLDNPIDVKTNSVIRICFEEEAKANHSDTEFSYSITIFILYQK